MSVEFHCGKCGKLIRAPRESAGKRGKCPYCKQSVYIPTPREELEEIPLAPIDEEGERQWEQLEREAEQLLTDLEHAKGGPDIDGGPTAPAEGPTGAAVDVNPLLISAVRALQASELDRADQLIGRLKQQADKSKAHIQALIVDEMPLTELEDCPPGLYKGFLRMILDRL